MVINQKKSMYKNISKMLFSFLGCVRSTDTKKGWQFCIESGGVHVWMVNVCPRVLMKSSETINKPHFCWLWVSEWMQEHFIYMINWHCLLYYGRSTLWVFHMDFSYCVWFVSAFPKQASKSYNWTMNCWALIVSYPIKHAICQNSLC